MCTKQEQELRFEINKLKESIKKSDSRYYKHDALKHHKKLEKELRHYRKTYYKKEGN